MDFHRLQKGEERRGGEAGVTAWEIFIKRWERLTLEGSWVLPGGLRQERGEEGAGLLHGQKSEKS